jgi:hypothetical protein
MVNTNQMEGIWVDEGGGLYFDSGMQDISGNNEELDDFQR